MNEVWHMLRAVNFGPVIKFSTKNIHQRSNNIKIQNPGKNYATSELHTVAEVFYLASWICIRFVLFLC